jgi:glucosylceramidase
MSRSPRALPARLRGDVLARSFPALVLALAFATSLVTSAYAGETKRIRTGVAEPGTYRVSVGVAFPDTRRAGALRLRIERRSVLVRAARRPVRRLTVHRVMRIDDGALDVRWRKRRGGPRVTSVRTRLREPGSATPVQVAPTSPDVPVSAPVPSGAVQTWTTTTAAGSLDLELDRGSILLGSTGPADLAISVDPDSTFQAIDGFGGALTDSAAWLIAGSPAREHIMGDLFGRGGAGFGVVRVPMGASDMARSAYTYDDTCCDLADFSIAHDTAYVIPLLREARELNPGLKILATPWSAPGWMKFGGSLLGDCADNRNYLRNDRYGDYADYFVRFLRAYAAHGIPIHAVSMQNEPNHCASDYPSMNMSSADQASFSVVLRTALDAAGFARVKIVGWDHNWYQGGSPAPNPHWLMQEPARAVDGVAYHCYESPEGGYAVQSAFHEAFPGAEVHFTECTGGAWSTNEAANLVWNLENTLIGPLRHWARTSLYWSLALTAEGGPHSGGCGNCRGMLTVAEEPGPHPVANAEYFAWAHLAKVVAPGAVRIASDDLGPGSLRSVAFRNPDGSRALVVLNADTDSRRSFHVSSGNDTFATALPPASVASFRWG